MPNASYPKELRAEAERLYREEGMSLREVADRLGVTAQSVHKWVRAGDATEDPATDTAEDKAEIRRLQRELRRTQQERDILKKAVAFFARDSEDR